MNYNISKELFEAVANLKYSYCNDKGIVYLNDNNCKVQKELLYNDFFFKCKEWALKHGYRIVSNPYDEKFGVLTHGIVTIYYTDFTKSTVNKIYECESDSEQQAVFDACQWILNNKGK